jgi:hypothetical protein
VSFVDVTCRLLVAVAVHAFAAATAAASPPPGLFVGDRTITFDPDEPLNIHIIDIDLMHARDCKRDETRGGRCILRWDDDPETSRLDILDGGVSRVSRRRFEILDTMLDSVEIVLDLDEPTPLDLD